MSQYNEVKFLWHSTGGFQGSFGKEENGESRLGKKKLEGWGWGRGKDEAVGG